MIANRSIRFWHNGTPVWNRRVVIAFALIFGALSALLAGCGRPVDIPLDEIRAERLNKVIMCPVCPGESIDQSQNDLALQMRGIIRDQIAEGWTDTRIRQFWIDRYGPGIILEPPREGFTLIAWLLPVAVALIAFSGLYVALKSMRRSPAAICVAPQTRPTETGPESRGREYYVRRIEAAIDSPPQSTARPTGPEGVAD
jgi:cytochrome c-type biogenesis protein CcmH